VWGVAGRGGGGGGAPPLGGFAHGGGGGEFVVTHRYTLLQQIELDRPSTDQHLSMLCFYQNIWTSNFCGYILTEGVFVTEVSSNAGISFC